MFDRARVLPAGPGERDDHIFPLRERLRFRNNLGLGLRDVRQRPAFATLARGPWQVFIAIACFWQSNAEAWPSQETIATFSGYSSRAVRDYVDVLERDGIVRLRRERQANGSERIYYAPGPVTLSELAAFVERFPRAPVTPRPTSPPEAISGAPPEATSMEHRDLRSIEPSSSQQPTSRVVEEEKCPDITEEDRDIARAALAERLKRKHPKRSPPPWFDVVEIAIVAACSSALGGDREAKLRAHLDAIDGAHCVSKDGPPTVRFIWGKLEHFLDHAERGRQRAEAAERVAQARDGARARAAMRDTPTVSLEQVAADYERIFVRPVKINLP